MIFLIRNLLVIISLVFIGFLFFRKNQDEKLNFSMFYSALFTIVSLAVVNYLCVELGYWEFNKESLNVLKIPFDLYFVWIIVWAVVPVYFFKGKKLLLLIVFVIWVDVIFMSKLGETNVLTLDDGWLIGEGLLISFVFIPSYLWAKFSYEDKHVGIRAVFQIVIMGLIFIIGVPFLLNSYGLIDVLSYKWSIIEFQIFLIIVFPAFVAVYDLVEKGKGTPFPYDSTKYIVKTGVYAYIRNPIQWSFTAMFISLSIYHSNLYLLLGSLFSVAYSYGVSDFQEYSDMEQRFGNNWLEYKKSVPKWYFQWKPIGVPKGTIYFDSECYQCNQIANWFKKYKGINLNIDFSSNYSKGEMLKVTYIDEQGVEYKSVEAIANALEHINLITASLGWFMRMPVIIFVLQNIVDAIGVGSEKEKCNIK